MRCKRCGETLEVIRRCQQVKLCCQGCSHEYQIHEVAAELDPETEAVLENYPCIIYD